jgi:hypothetical protein
MTGSSAIRRGGHTRVEVDSPHFLLDAYGVRTFTSIPQDAVAVSSYMRVVRLDRDYLSLQDLLGICSIDGVPREVMSVFNEHSPPWREGEMVVLTLRRVTGDGLAVPEKRQ